MLFHESIPLWHPCTVGIFHRTQEQASHPSKLPSGSSRPIEKLPLPWLERDGTTAAPALSVLRHALHFSSIEVEL